MHHEDKDSGHDVKQKVTANRHGCSEVSEEIHEDVEGTDHDQRLHDIAQDRENSITMSLPNRPHRVMERQIKKFVRPAGDGWFTLFDKQHRCDLSVVSARTISLIRMLAKNFEEKIG